MSEPNAFRSKALKARYRCESSGRSADISSVKDKTDGVGADTVFVCVGTVDAVAFGWSEREVVNIFGGCPVGPA